jgi:Domain of unknown function (DUF4386)
MGANTASYRLATTLQIYALIPVIFGMIALYAILATTPARRWAMASLVLTISGAGLALPGGGFAAVVMPAAGVLLSQGVEENVVALLDQVYREPALIAVFLGGLLYNAGLLITSVAVWRSGAFPRWMAVLVAATAIIGTATFLTCRSLPSLPWQPVSPVKRCRKRRASKAFLLSPQQALRRGGERLELLLSFLTNS